MVRSNHTFHVVRWALVCALSATLVMSAGPALAQISLVVNPYAETDWWTSDQYRANLHTHTTESDGSMGPGQVIDEYYARGYQILVLTDHDLCTWPWEKFERTAADLGMLTVPGNELSRHHHAGSYFCEYVTEEKDLDAALAGVTELDGLAVLFHPGRYWKLPEGGDATVPGEVVEQYAGIFTRNPHMGGMEVINQGNRYSHDRMLWDALLARMMPDHPVWGYANDDMHSIQQMGNDWNVFPLESLAEGDLRQAMVSGAFYFCSVSTHPEDERSVDRTPTINGITHDPETGVITISATLGDDPLADDAIAWIADGQTVHVGPSLDYRNTQGIRNYVRAELTGPGGTTYTNPFGFRAD